ncbi:MAG: hypothetical protein SGI77_00565 [Pirellulaceae bacterium]|nr:hypothetical protein [Pirellulaceae bacterium]
MTSANRSSRRRFLVQATAHVSAIGIAGEFVGGFVVHAGEPVVPSQPDSTSKFTPAMHFTVQGKHVMAMAVGPNDQIYVGVDRQVKVFDRDGSPLQTLDFKRLPRGLAVDEVGTVYVAMARGIEVVGVANERKQWSLPEGDVWLNSVALNGNEVCVADSANKVIWRFDQSGSRLGHYVPATGNATRASEFFAMSASKGRLHVADPRRHQVSTFDDGGQRERSWGVASRDLAGFSGCCNPVSLAVRDDGSIVTAERGIPRVKLFSGSGEFLAMIAGPENFKSTMEKSIVDSVVESTADADCSTGGLIVAVDAARRTLVLDPTTRKIQVFA